MFNQPAEDETETANPFRGSLFHFPNWRGILIFILFVVGPEKIIFL